MALKVKFEGYEVEGSVDEIALLIKRLTSNLPHQVDEKTRNKDAPSDSMPSAFAKLALTRRPLSTAQRKLLRLLLRRPDGWTPSSAIMEKLELNGNQYGGLFGAIGRRVSNTEGYKEGYSLFEWQWNDDTEENDCRLHPAALPIVSGLNP